MRTLVVTPVSGDKLGNIDSVRPDTHNELVIRGAQRVWAEWGPQLMDVAVVTGRFELQYLNKGDPGTADSADLPVSSGVSASEEPKALNRQIEAMAGGYDIVFLLLSGQYLSALRPPLEDAAGPQRIYLTSHDSLGLVPAAASVHSVVADGPVAARRWHVKADRVRGFLFGRLCGQVVEHGPVLLEWLQRRPQDTERLFYKRAHWRPQWPLWEA